jgi:glutamate---cysteine ligase / carboxylate-amine ligase
MPADFTLGVEEELHLIDLDKGSLSASAPQVLSRLPTANYSAELQRTTVETNTPVVETLSDLRAEIMRLRAEVIEVAAAEGIGVAAVGTAPIPAPSDIELTPGGRFGRMHEQYRLLVDEQLICGVQIHVGVKGPDLAVRIAQRVARDLPVLLAVSASSPYWNGQDTGYASIRNIIWQRWPSAGSTGWLGSAAEYDLLVQDLIRSGVIADAKMAYFDVRPSAHAPTLELRVTDACPIADDTVLLAGLFRAMVLAEEQQIAAAVPHTPLPQPIYRAAMWQAARSGLAGDLLDLTSRARPVPAADAVMALVDRLGPQLERTGDVDEVTRLAEAVLTRGNSADRQRAAFAERGSLDDVVTLVVAETQGPADGPAPDDPALSSYPSRAGDEAVGLASRARPAYRDIMHFYGVQDPGALEARHRAKDEWVGRHRLSFVVAGEHRALDVDLVPRLIADHEWAELAAGLEQRARAIEMFLQDIYTEQRVLADGVLPPETALEAPGWRPEAQRLPKGVVRAPIMGFDLVRSDSGGWRVLEDNLRSPSGTAYALALRELMDDVMPDLPRPDALLDPRAAVASMRSVLLGPAGPAGQGAVLTSGPASGARYEHERLAAELGFLLVEVDELQVDGRHVRRRADGTQIDALYLRIDGELADLVDAAGRAVGGQLLRLAAEGRLFLANAPGNGVADDKIMYCHVPELISYYLDERQLLDSVPTYRPSMPTERQIVLERVGELVTKPVDGHGGHGVLVGPWASAADVTTRRAEIAAHPQRWVAQEVVSLSSHPTLDDARLQPRHVDLRAFVHVGGTQAGDCVAASLALTRVAPARSLIVNSSQGGGAKDTWIVRTGSGAGTSGGGAHVRSGR